MKVPHNGPTGSATELLRDSKAGFAKERQQRYRQASYSVVVLP